MASEDTPYSPLRFLPPFRYLLSLKPTPWPFLRPEEIYQHGPLTSPADLVPTSPDLICTDESDAEMTIHWLVWSGAELLC